MTEQRTSKRVRVEVLDHSVSRRDRLIEDVRAGLTSAPKILPPKYFYDARGSELFEEITRLPEYYPTRAETSILESCALELLEAVRPTELIEIGSGSSRKTQLLIEALHDVGGTTYVPLDVSADALRAAVERLSDRFRWLEIHGFVGDFEEGFPDWPHGGRRLICFLGSTIGNLEPEERVRFLRNVRELLGPGDGFLLGVDLIKDPAVLQAAYDDSRGVTAAFNKNVLRVLDRELDGDFREEDFRHVARYDPDLARIEMHLEARSDLRVRLAAIDLDVVFQEGERVRTEISCKFDRPRVEHDLAAAGLALDAWRTDPEGCFALVLARPG